MSKELCKYLAAKLLCPGGTVFAAGMWAGRPL